MACGSIRTSTRRPSSVAFLALLPVILQTVLLPAVVSGKTDPSTGRCRVIWVGEICPSNEMVLDWIAAEPRFELTSAVPCDLQWLDLADATRFARIYLPRRYADLFSGVDVAVFHDFHPKVLPVGSIEWFRTAVEEGFGLCLIEFAYRAAGYAGMDMWPEMKIYDAFPGKFVINQIEAIKGRQYYRVVRSGPLVDFPGMEKRIMNWGWHGDLQPREGSVVWAVWRGRGTPALVTGEYGKGKVIQPDHGWDTIPEDTKRNWRYASDFVYNHIIFAADLSFPDDVELVHVTREKFVRFKQEKAMAILVLEFIEKFGVNPTEFERRMGEMKADREEAERLYIEASVVSAAKTMEGLLDRLDEMGEEMMEAKDRVMLWIYIAEWLVVSGTMMAGGAVLWTLMVKRRLYRDIKVTRSVKNLRRSWER